MDSKHVSDEELPPPYSVRASDRTSASHGIRSSSVSHLQQHLASLPNRIRMTREAYSVQQSLDDTSLLDFLLPEVDDFLAYLGNLHTTPRLAHLTLIPDVAVPRNAILSGMEEMRQRGEPCRVARVSINLGGDERKKSAAARSPSRDTKNVEDWSTGREFSDWGRFGDSTSDTDSPQARDMLWWRDESMARRLARHLQPAPAKSEPAPLQTPVQATVEQRLPAQKEKKGWFWSKKPTASSNNSTFATKSVKTDVEVFPGRDAATQPAAEETREKEDDGTKMSVIAEEVAFRSENDFGIMESTRGWAVVVTIHIKT
ncbi:putative NAD-dependent epimerase dehydratase family protein [Rosellinia necatrix]|uniref:Putative NAD-dependent epimerase dehydratase family protein n=1 Tax=Rosellinia necatrix TaxID=77044 RepID=A0A1S7UKR7_ROSNE|nr:putative NAD-dependent epimerase dehydratase family protein [Rosellinia necatrix]